MKQQLRCNAGPIISLLMLSFLTTRVLGADGSSTSSPTGIIDAVSNAVRAFAVTNDPQVLLKASGLLESVPVEYSPSNHYPVSMAAIRAAAILSDTAYVARDHKYEIASHPTIYTRVLPMVVDELLSDYDAAVVASLSNAPLRRHEFAVEANKRRHEYYVRQRNLREVEVRCLRLVRVHASLLRHDAATLGLARQVIAESCRDSTLAAMLTRELPVVPSKSR